jgi:hypothetical protein
MRARYRTAPQGTRVSCHVPRAQAWIGKPSHWHRYTQVQAHTHTHTHTHWHRYTHMHTHAWAQAQAQAHTHTHWHRHLHTRWDSRGRTRRSQYGWAWIKLCRGRIERKSKVVHASTTMAPRNSGVGAMPARMPAPGHSHTPRHQTDRANPASTEQWCCDS